MQVTWKFRDIKWQNIQQQENSMTKNCIIKGLPMQQSSIPPKLMSVEQLHWLKV
jgi:hypothetical protein